MSKKNPEYPAEMGTWGQERTNARVRAADALFEAQIQVGTAIRALHRAAAHCTETRTAPDRDYYEPRALRDEAPFFGAMAERLGDVETNLSKFFHTIDPRQDQSE